MACVRKGFIPSLLLVVSPYQASTCGQGVKDLPLNVFTTSFRAPQTASSPETSGSHLHSVQAQQHLLLSALSPGTTRETNPSLGGVQEIPYFSNSLRTNKILKHSHADAFYLLRSGTTEWKPGFVVSPGTAELALQEAGTQSACHTCFCKLMIGDTSTHCLSSAHPMLEARGSWCMFGSRSSNMLGI